jgi:putative PIN family toxin of toxin-antitoxin system
MTIVLDTNIVVSGVFFRSGNEARLLDLFKEDKYKLALSPAILKEYKTVLNRDDFKSYAQFDQNFIDEWMDDFRQSGFFCSGDIPVTAIKADPSDEKFLSCAVEAEADAIVTGDGKHLLPIGSYKNIPIIRAAECLDLLENKPNEPAPTSDYYEKLKELSIKTGKSIEQLIEEFAQRAKENES